MCVCVCARTCVCVCSCDPGLGPGQRCDLCLVHAVNTSIPPHYAPLFDTIKGPSVWAPCTFITHNGPIQKGFPERMHSLTCTNTHTHTHTHTHTLRETQTETHASTHTHSHKHMLNQQIHSHATFKHKHTGLAIDKNTQIRGTTTYAHNYT